MFNDIDGNAAYGAEPGIPGVAITLTTAAGQVSTTSATATGAYTFTNVPAGAFTLTVGTPPAGFVATTRASSTASSRAPRPPAMISDSSRGRT